MPLYMNNISSHVRRVRPPTDTPRPPSCCANPIAPARSTRNLSKEGLSILLKGGTAIADLTTAFDITRQRRRSARNAQAAPRPHPRRHRLARTRTRHRPHRRAHPRPRLEARHRARARRRHRARLPRRCSASRASTKTNAAMDIHLSDGALVLYDLTSTYFEGRSTLATLATAGATSSLAVQPRGVPRGRGDPSTVGVLIEKLAGASRVWCSSATAGCSPRRASVRRSHRRGSAVRYVRPAIRELMSSGAVQRSMFDDTDLAEIRCDAYPGDA